MLFQQPWTAMVTSPSGAFVCTPTNGLYCGNLLQVIAYLLLLLILQSTYYMYFHYLYESHYLYYIRSILITTQF